MRQIRVSKLAALFGACATGVHACAVAAGSSPLEEVVVLAPYATAVDPELVPANVQRAVAEELQRSQSLDLTDFLNRNFGSVSINHAQNNPLQPDFNFRGFTASPLLGTPGTTDIADAALVSVAVARTADIVTSDRGDIERLVAKTRVGIRVIDT